MPVFTISLADRIIGIDCIYNRTQSLCRNYFSEGAPDFYVRVSQSDIETERDNSQENTFSDAYLETLAVYRKICDRMAEYDTFMMHGAVVAVGNEAYMFTAPSGTGKTTHIRLWLKNIPGAYVVNGDKPLISALNGHFFACGTPWCGKESLNTKANVPLKAVFLLSRGEKNIVKEISPAEHFAQLLGQINIPQEEGAAIRVMKLTERFMNEMRFYGLQCNMEDEAANVSFAAIHNQL